MTRFVPVQEHNINERDMGVRCDGSDIAARLEGIRMQTTMERRQFLQTSLASAMLANSSQASAADTKTSPDRLISIQIPMISFYDEGIDSLLDTLQQRIPVNTLFIATSGDRGFAGRQLPDQPLPDHGSQVPDTTFRGGNFCTPHMQFYKDIGIRLKDTQAPEMGGRDMLPQIVDAGKKRGMRVMAFISDWFYEGFPNLEAIAEVDVHGKASDRGCYNNPMFRNYLNGLNEDYLRSYDIDGIMWAMEATGALGNAITYDPMRCFCRFCEAKAREQGIDMEKARKGFLQLESFQVSARQGRRPVDGYYTTFWRILLRNPEMLAWENFWHDSLKSMYRDLYDQSKGIRPATQCGWHIQQQLSFDPLYRAEREVREFEGHSDFLKISTYNNASGDRFSAFAKKIHQGVYADLSLDEVTDFSYRVLNFDEGKIDKIPYTGWSPDYVARETKRAVDGAIGTNIKILTAPDIDVPTAPGHSKSTPENTRASVMAALAQKPDGIVMSRKYSEMRLANIAGAGDAMRASGWG